jgi:antagonist of KipI
MADHQTTGGYPRIAHVITAHHSSLAQMRPDDAVRFSVTNSKTAETLLLKQQQHLLQLENACKFRLQDFFKN